MSTPTQQTPPTAPGEMTFGGLTIEAYSLGGVETVVRLPAYKLAIDVGCGPRSLLRCDHYALTHTHMDHAAGIPYLIALRQLFGRKPPTVYLPAQSKDAFAAMLEGWRKVQRFELDCVLVGVEAGQRYRIRKDAWLEPFRTYHPVPSVGYTLIETNKRLKPELRGLPGREIAALRRQGHTIDEQVERRLISVSGDTLAQVLEKSPQLLDSEVVVLECTFLDDRKSLVHAHAGGHIHLSDLSPARVAAINTSPVETLVLSHFSQIYGPKDIGRLLGPLRAALRPVLRAMPTEAGSTEATIEVIDSDDPDDQGKAP